MAQAGQTVLILDLDLESPGLSSALLPANKQPTYGITDWLVEDLVDNTAQVLDAMVAHSDLSRDGTIYVVPAHGAEPGEYVAKLGRVWMAKTAADGSRENWSQRLQRLICALETKYKPDVILIDSRAGIDEVAASCVTDLGAKLVLLFAIEGAQTWSGYRILCEHWLKTKATKKIRERLQIVAALTPETDRQNYLETMRDSGYVLFADTQYDGVPAGEITGDRWHFEATDADAPHYPWQIKWHRSFQGLTTLHGRLAEIDSDEVNSIFGPLIRGIAQTIDVGAAK